MMCIKPVEQSEVGARRVAQVQVGIGGDVNAPRVGHDEPGAPLPFRARILMPMTGCCSVVLLPMMKMHPLCSVMSRIELVIAPLPKLVTRPVTVALCHNRAQ